MIIEKEVIIGAFLGVLIAFVSGHIIFKLNEIYFPEFATQERLTAWVIIFGIFFSFLIIHMVLKKKKIKVMKGGVGDR